MNRPLVYVIIINWNGREHLDACFSSLLAGDYPNARFLLLDNASTDGSVAYVRERFGHDARVCWLACEENHGWSGGNNLGIQAALEADAAYVFLLNNDIAIAPDAISKLVEQAEATPDCACLAPKMLLYNTPSVLNSVGLYCSRVGAAWDRGIGCADGPEWDAIVPVIGVCGGAMFIRADVFGRVGLLPEDFVIYLDDLDLCLRMWSFGYRILTCPKAEVRHKFSASMGQEKHARRKYFLNNRNRFRIILRNFPLRHWPQTLFWVALGEVRAVGRALLEGAYWKAGCHVQAWISALGQLSGALRYQWKLQRQGARSLRFWKLIERRRMFCPRIVLPESGWYPPRPHTFRTAAGTMETATLHPMAPTATLEYAPGQQLCLRLVNCLPAHGACAVTVWLDGEQRATWKTQSDAVFRTESLFESPPVEAVQLELRACQCFPAERTGEDMDVGAWFDFNVSEAPNMTTQGNMQHP